MTVIEFAEKLEKLKELGFAESVIYAWDPEIEDYLPVTGYVYGTPEEPIQLFTDDQE